VLKRAGQAEADGGFTLIEMIVVLVVLGLVAGLVLARGPLRSAAVDLRAATSAVAEGLRGARGQAIATNRPVVFRVDVAAHLFAVDDAPPRRLPDSLGLSVTTIAKAVAGRDVAGIVFAPDGSSSGGRVDLTLGVRHARVDVAWLTGRVTVAEAADPDAAVSSGAVSSGAVSSGAVSSGAVSSGAIQ
jgi:general secretion pathway protein H